MAVDTISNRIALEREMEWMIEGADANTGEDVRLIIEAETIESAEGTARDKGVLISSTSAVGVATVVSTIEPPVKKPIRKQRISPAAMNTMIPQTDGHVARSPEYPDIVSGNRWLRILSLVCTVVAYISMLLAIAIFIWPLIQMNGSPSAAMVLAAGGAAIVPALIGIWMFITGVVLRMIGSTAIAIRDIARNSF